MRFTRGLLCDFSFFIFFFFYRFIFMYSHTAHTRSPRSLVPCGFRSSSYRRWPVHKYALGAITRMNFVRFSCFFFLSFCLFYLVFIFRSHFRIFDRRFPDALIVADETARTGFYSQASFRSEWCSNASKSSGVGGGGHLSWTSRFPLPIF